MGYRPRFRPNPDILVGKKPNGYDPHITRQLELECFGKEWVREYGTRCDCFRCNPPKGPGPGSKPVIPKSRTIGGVVWPIPEGVPDNAHFKVIEGRWGYLNDFHEGTWTWIDETSGQTMSCRVIGIGDHSLTPAARQRHDYMSMRGGL